MSFNVNAYEKLSTLDGIYGIWHYNKYLRVTFVSKTWLIVWDHRHNPPKRYDCEAANHEQTCTMVANKLQELTTS